MKWENRWCVSTELCSPRRERERRGEEKEEVTNEGRKHSPGQCIEFIKPSLQ